jgi:acetolactate synthase-1/2/3 large subunit
MSVGRPVVIDCIIDEDDKVFPMVPAGASIADGFDQDDLDAKTK